MSKHPPMDSMSCWPQWAIPGVGLLWPCFDYVQIVSSESVGALKALLPVAQLERACHSFNVLTYQGPDPRLQSRMVIVGTRNAKPWLILAQHEAVLGRYRVTQAEVAFDAHAHSIADAYEKFFALTGMLTKRRHQRRYLWSVHKPDNDPRPGYVSAPTFYFEDRKSSVKLKAYLRHQKLPGRGFGGPCVRLEWTLTGRRALTRHIDGNRIQHLLTADLNSFIKRNLRLERVDHAALGNLLFPPRRIPPNAQAPRNDPDYRAKRAALLALRNLAYRERDKFGDWNTARRTCRDSPAQIRGYLRGLRDGKRPRKRGRPKDKSKYRPITDYRIDACFQPIELIPVTPARYNYSCLTKITPITAGNSNACGLKKKRQA